MRKLGEFLVDEHIVAANHFVKGIKRKLNVVDWDIVALRNHFSWGGYVSRLALHDPRRATIMTLQFKDYKWLSLIEAQNAGRQLHGRYLRVWRWEYAFVQYAKYVGISDWHELACNKRSWLESLETMAEWYRNNRATRL